MKHILIIAYHFPPCALSGIFRILAWVRLLAQRGWKVTVLTVNHSEGPLDEGLLKKVPKDVKVIRTHCINVLQTLGKFKNKLRKKPNKPFSSASIAQSSKKASFSFIDWLTWWLHIPDAHIGWLPFGLLRAVEIIQKEGISIIYSTSPFMTAHLIAGLTKTLTGLPWVADFRDPWCANPFRHIPYKLINKWDKLLEAWSLRQADHVICVTDYMRKDFIHRYPDIENKITTIPNGYDPEDFKNVKAIREFDNYYFILTHAGTFYGPRSPIPVLKAMSLFKHQYPDLARKFRLQLIGPTTYNEKPLQEISLEFNVADMVKIIPMIPKPKALGYLKGSDGLLLVGFKGKNSQIQIPGKFYEYLAISKPMLILAPEESDLAEIFKTEGIPGEICDPDDIASITTNLKKLMENKNKYQPPSQIERFNRHNLVIQLENILNKILTTKKQHN